MSGILSIDHNRALNDSGNNSLFLAKADKQSVTVGQKLSQARRKLRESNIDAISAELCMRSHFLEALEQDHFDVFPSACYAAGFLKNYATYLGLNVEQIVGQYRTEFKDSTKKVDLVFFEVEEISSRPNQMILSLVILIGLIFFGIWYSVTGGNALAASSLPDVSDITSHIVASALGPDHK